MSATEADGAHLITSVEALADHYQASPPQGSVDKVSDHLTEPYRRWIEASPFLALATIGPDGMDCSPRGDRGSVVTVVDDRTVHLPDRRGNNRLDNLRNIVVDGRVALLFMVPGVSECLRINGTAVLDADPALLAAYAVDGRRPKSVIVVTIGEVYFQCARAIKRSGLWDVTGQVDPADLPTAGQMTKAAGSGDFDAESYDAALADRQAATLY